ncbi:MAG: NACHT domain-containing protein, partial [Gammaproteobacteria bacterium]|nr:NACHT domain-containing protein [Gammaproteobacteria bacterium]
MNNVSRLFISDYVIKIYLLGGFRITNMRDEDITPTAAKARCILAILVLSEKGEITRDKLSQLLWSRHANEQARTSLRQSLSLLRRTFQVEAPELFTADRNKVYLKRDKIWLDSHEIINNATELLEYGILTNICCGPSLENLNTNDSAFKSWLVIEKQALEKNIKTVLQAHLSKIIKNEEDKAKRNAIEESLLKIDPSNILTLPLDSAANSISADDKKDKNFSEEKPQSPKTLSVTNNHGKIHLERDLLLYRNSLLKKVMVFWINGVLENSLFKKVKIELQLREKSEHVFDGWKDIVRYSMSRSISDHNTGSKRLRCNAEIGDIFTGLGESMLILGAPGSGKTTLLLSLTQQLVERAEKDNSCPIPVVFHLSTWANQRASLDTWLENELENRYQMPRKLGVELIQNHGILPLLDGLDEVDDRYRLDCVDAINNYRQ